MELSTKASVKVLEYEGCLCAVAGRHPEGLSEFG
jgi:hypothetical protein